MGLAPSKAKYLQGLSQQIVERHGGQVPRSLEELEALPGVGHKTASVVVSQGFGVPAFPVRRASSPSFSSPCARALLWHASSDGVLINLGCCAKPCRLCLCCF